MEFRNQQFREALQKTANGIKPYTPTAEEIEITEKLIGQNIDSVETELGRYRKSADRIILNGAAKKLNPPEANRIAREYPLGCCKYIRDTVMDKMEDSALLEKYIAPTRRSILNQVQLCVRITDISGVIDLPGDKNIPYFHNLIQAGNYILDVANDTVNTTQRKIKVSKIEESGYRGVKSLLDYIEISEKYRKITFERNTAITDLAPLFPLIETGPRLTDKGTVMPKLIYQFPPHIMADALLRNGLKEFEEVYHARPAPDEETVKRVLAGASMVNPGQTEKQSELSIEESFSSIEELLSSPKVTDDILKKLNSVITRINREIAILF